MYRQQCSVSVYGHRLNSGGHKLVISYLQAAVASVCLLLSMNFICVGALPTTRHQTKESDSLSNIIRDMENAIFRLKEFSLRLDYENRKNDIDFDDPSTDNTELQHRHFQLDESYPEIVAELHDKKSTDENILPSKPEDAAAGKPEKSGGNSKDQVSDSQATKPVTASSAGGKILTDNDAPDDMSLREALEFLVGLAKEKKQEKKAKESASP